MINSKKKCAIDSKEIRKAIMEIGNDKTQNSTEFICNYCSRSFTRKYNIINHIQNFHMNTSHCCEICKQRFGSNVGLQLHMSKGHNRFKQPNPECDVCGKIFTRKANIIPHLATMHDIGVVPSLSCNVCNKTFTTERNLKRHVLKLHNPYLENPICDECNMVFPDKKDLINHIQVSHNISVNNINSCRLCERVYCREKNLKRHVEVYHGGKFEFEQKFKCTYCPKVYTTKHSLKRHIRTVHSDGVKIYQALDGVGKNNCCKCDCGKTFEEEPLLRKHIKNEHPFDVFYTYCKNFLLRTTNAEEKIVDEKANMTPKTEEKRSFQESFESDIKLNDNTQLSETCNVCFTKFYSKEVLARHKTACVPPDDVNRCTFCEKLFTEKQSLQFHIKVFHPQISNTRDPSPSKEPLINDLKCEYCDKVFKLKQNVKKHTEHIHFGIQRYKCLECESMFTERRNLRKHIRLKHTNSKNFSQCHFCRKLFESAKACTDHLQVTHSYHTKTFPCEICSRWFEDNDSLKKHMKTTHTEDEVFKCENCTLLLHGFEAFEKHKRKCQEIPVNKQSIPRCVICMKDFSCLKTLIRHIKQFHEDFNAKELADFGYSNRVFVVDCQSCLKSFNDDDIYEIYLENKDVSDAIVFKCDDCGLSYNVLEFAIQRFKMTNNKRKRILYDDKVERIHEINEMEDESMVDGKSDSDIEIVEDENL